MMELQERGFFFFNCLLGFDKSCKSLSAKQENYTNVKSFDGNVDNVKWQRNDVSNQADHKWRMPEREQLCVFSLHSLGPYYYNQT